MLIAGGMIMNRRILVRAFFLLVVIPGFVFSRMSKWPEPQTSAENATQSERGQQFLTVLSDGKLIQMELEEYVQCVLLGEIPPDFETETLKAQAIATRTYTLKNMQKEQKHEAGVLCADSNCCQAFCMPTEYLLKGGSEVYIRRIRDAVRQTSGVVLLYNGDLIEATYFSASGGRTEAAVEVWGKDVPYLQSVESFDEQDNRYDGQCVYLTPQEFLVKLNLPQYYADHITCTDTLYTSGNGVASITVCGKEYTGKKVRELLELPSTIFKITVEEDFVCITTNGNGHRVGMSQYGADAMATQGKTYSEILAHYYPGTCLHTIDWEEYKGAFDKAGNL